MVKFRFQYGQMMKSLRSYFHKERQFAAVQDTPNAYGVTARALCSLMEKRGIAATEALKSEFGSIHELVKRLGSDENTGLSSDSQVIDNQKECFGENSIPPPPSKTFIGLCFSTLRDPLLIVLLLCAIVSVGLSFYHPPGGGTDLQSSLEWIEGVAILVAVMIVVFVTAANDYQKDKQFRGLQRKLEGSKVINVFRDGKLTQINKTDLVVGDIYAFRYGDLLQADGFLTQGNDVAMDEASLTGESDLVKKNDKNRIMMSGTNVMEGSGQMLVVAVGLNSQTGKILKLMEGHQDDKPDEEMSPDGAGKKKKTKKPAKDISVLSAKLKKLAIVIAKIGLSAAILTFISLVVRFCVITYVINKEPWNNGHISYFVDSFVQGITVVVVAVPEGLPLAVTLALAFAVKRMVKDNNLVRHLNACETMGNATTICSDKTGTLTTNRMAVTQCYLAGKHYKKATECETVDEELLDLIAESISVNTGYSSFLKPSKTAGAQVDQIGNKTECGLLAFVQLLRRNYEQYRKQNPENGFHKVFTFNSKRKMMATVLKRSNGYYVHVKGASEIVLQKCTSILMDGKKTKKLSASDAKKITKTVIESMTKDALRTLCVAFKFLPNEAANSIDWDDEPTLIRELTCLCIVGIQDPVREEVPKAIQACQRAGVVVRMVTGDNVNTARSIAQQCGIIEPNSDFLILESSEFNKRIRDGSGNLNKTQFDSVWPRLRVLARSSPEDKYVLVKGIVESKATAHREIVAVTGDGTNDAPALKIADVGFAMGIQGTDVAKEACDIILIDDNFTSIVKALMWGRNVYDNIAKFLQFQLTANVSAGVLSVISAATIGRVPLSAIQMLWVNLIMDTLASVGLASEKPTQELLNRKPYGRTKFIISPLMCRNIFGHGVYQLSVLFLLIFYGRRVLDTDSMVDAMAKNPKLKYPTQHFTCVFNAFVLMTLFNEINSRKLHGESNVFSGLRNNLVFIVIWLTCMILQVMIVTFGGIIFSVVSLRIDQWAYCLMFGFGSLLFGQLLNKVPVTMFTKVMRWLSKKVDKKRQKQADFEMTSATDSDDSAVYFDDDSEGEDDEVTGLWYRGVKRVQFQDDTIQFFKKYV